MANPSTAQVTQSATRTSPWTPRTIAGLVLSVLLLCSAVVWAVFIRTQGVTELVIGTGNRVGVYHRLGLGLEKAFAKHPTIRIRARETSGSPKNMALLQAGGVDLAIVQDDTPGNASARSVSLLHKELLHILIRRDLSGDITNPSDLVGKTVALGEKESGTAAVAAAILSHFDIAKSEIKTEFRLPGRIREGFRKKEIDAAFVLSALPSDVVDEACSTGEAVLLPIGKGNRAESAAAGIAAANPRFSPATLPASTYGTMPSRAVHTISVSAVLVAAKKLDADIVRDFTSHLFASRIILAAAHPIAHHLREKYEPWNLRYPAHEGAIAFYERNTPPFLVKYAEAIALLITLLLGALSGIATLRKLSAKRKKELIDFYYKRIAEIVSSPDAESGTRRRQQLLDLRAAAFQHLVDEELAPDESFTIFQDFLRGELRALEPSSKTAE